MYICRVEDRIGNGYIPGSRDDIASYFFLEKQGFHARGVTDGPSRRLRAGHGRSRAGDRKPLPNGPANPIAAAWLLQFRNKTSEITV